MLELELGSRQAMKDDHHLIMDVHVLVQYLIRALPAVLQVLEVDIVQGHILLSPDEGMTTLFPQVESMLTTQDSRGMLHENRMVITITDRILQVMKMVLNRTKMEVVMLRNLLMVLKKEGEIIGDQRLVEQHQGLHLDQGLDLLICHLG